MSGNSTSYAHTVCGKVENADTSARADPAKNRKAASASKLDAMPLGIPGRRSRIPGASGMNRCLDRGYPQSRCRYRDLHPTARVPERLRGAGCLLQQRRDLERVHRLDDGKAIQRPRTGTDPRHAEVSESARKRFVG